MEIYLAGLNTIYPVLLRTRACRDGWVLRPVGVSYNQEAWRVGTGLRGPRTGRVLYLYGSFLYLDGLGLCLSPYYVYYAYLGFLYPFSDFYLLYWGIGAAVVLALRSLVIEKGSRLGLPLVVGLGCV